MSRNNNIVLEINGEKYWRIAIKKALKGKCTIMMI